MTFIRNHWSDVSNLQKPQKASSKMMLYLVQLALIIFYITIHQFSFHLINENLAEVNVPDLVKIHLDI